MGIFNFNFGDFGTNWGSDFIGGSFAIDGEATVDAGGVSGLTVQWIGGDAEIAYHNSSFIRLEQTCKKEIPEDRQLVYKVENGTLFVREGAESKVRSRTDTSLVIYLPNDFSFGGSVDFSCVSTDLSIPSLKVGGEAKFGTVSGDIELHGASCDGAFELSTTSGDIVLSGLSAAAKAEISTTSGDIELSNCSLAWRDKVSCTVSTTSGDISLSAISAGGTLELSAVNGDIEGAGLACAYLQSGAVNGDVSLDLETVQIEASTVGGDIDIVAQKSPAKVTMGSTNGDLTLHLPGDIAGFSATWSKVNGDFETDFACMLSKSSASYGDGSTQIQLDTVNGDLSIRRR